ncbi:MAG TPA: hypothetical protein VKZ57_02715 [Sphingobacterium sp.]|nr:hypothetical protein [Sphingobacterium sp.]
MSKVKEFITDQNMIHQSHIAFRMWPNNVSADSYLRQKLKGVLPWTAKDEQKAKAVLKYFAKIIRNELEP